MNKPKMARDKTKLQKIVEKHAGAAKTELKEIGVFVMLSWPLPDPTNEEPEATLESNVDLTDYRSRQHLVFYLRQLTDRLERMG